MRYFIGKDGNRLGPFSADQVRKQLAAGQISHADLVWREGMATWAPLSTEFPPATQPPPLPTGDATPAPENPPRVAAPFAPRPALGAFVRQEDTAAAATPSADHGPVLAERGRRLLAASIDQLIVILCLIPGLMHFLPGFMDLVVKAAETGAVPSEAVLEQMLTDAFTPWGPLFLAVGVGQAVLLSLRGQTIGKLLCRIRIVMLDGRPAGFVHAFLLRAVVISVFGLIPVLGFVIVTVIDPAFIFREDRRCLHDLIAGTAVVDV